MSTFQFRSVLFAFLIISGLGYSQDTLSVYFSTGSHQISKKEEQRLNQLPKDYDLSSVDSIVFIGMADSVGSPRSNLRLSLRRAKQVEKYTNRLINDDISTQSYARGEADNPEKPQNRRVDAILYYQSVPVDKPTAPAVREKKCYTVDYKLLRHANWRAIKHRKKEKVLIELPENYLLPEYDLYYGTREADGSFSYRKIRWKKKTTGRSWWSEKRLVTSLPKSSFDSYRIFRLEDPPCNDCNEPFDSVPKITKSLQCVQEDQFVMQNFQFSYKLFDRNHVKVRVPKEYIDSTINYYAGRNSESQKINWETKANLRKDHYYFTELNVQSDRIQPILKDAICPIKHYSECIDNGSSGFRPRCGFRGYEEKGLSFIGEIGNHYHNNNHLPYAALGFKFDRFDSRFSLLAGSDSNLGLYSSLRYDYHFLYLPLQQLNPLKSWHDPGKINFVTSALYLGTELKTSLNNKTDPLLDQNFHLGFAVINNSENPIISRVFLQYGYGYDYFQNQNLRFYPILHGGIVFEIIDSL